MNETSNASGRVTEQHHSIYRVFAGGEEYIAALSGRLSAAGSREELPVVGDNVCLRIESGSAVITEVLERKSLIARKAAGTTEELQPIAANVDVVFVCMALDANYNLRRLERYIAAVGGPNIETAVLLTKADLCPDAAARRDAILAAYPGARVILCSNTDGRGYREAASLVGPGVTAVFTGSSGVGKSTLINFLSGAGLRTGSVREDDGRGRHTTTHRQLIMLENGGAVIDTPGMRELAIYSGDVYGAFPEIERLAGDCRFTDCTHRNEPGCAIIEAVERGEVDRKRYESYLKLDAEQKLREKRRAQHRHR